MQKGGHNRNSQRIKAAHLHEQVANRRKDFCASRAGGQPAPLAQPVLRLEHEGHDAGPQFRQKRLKQWVGTFRAMLVCKLDEQGKRPAIVGKWRPPSKTCPKRGEAKDSLALSERAYCCGSGINTAISIRNEGLRLLMA
jgi:transposase